METFINDLRFALRFLRQRPGFSIVAILTLAIGIGGNTTIFTVVNSAMLRPLPYRDPGGLVIVWEKSESAGYPKVPLSNLDFLDFRDRTQTLEGMSMFGFGGGTLTAPGEPTSVRISGVSPEVFDLLGATPKLGRTFTAQEEEPGQERTAILSHAFWMERFGGDESVVGSNIELGGTTHTVVGVMREDFLFPPPVTFFGQTLSTTVQIFTPMVMDRTVLQRGTHQNMTIARIAPGYSIDQVQSEMASIMTGLADEYPDDMAGLEAFVTRVRGQSVELIRTTIFLLALAVGLVLLIACANVANLLLARANSRRREIAVRIALGAERVRLVRQMLTESLLLAVIGGALGLLLAVGGTSVLNKANPLQLPTLYAPRLDLPVLLFTMVVIFVTSVLFGLLPALQSTRTDLRSALQQGVRTTGDRGQNRAKRVFVVVETALAVLVLIGAGLTLRSFAALSNVEPGYYRTGVQTFEIVLPSTRYPEPAQREAFFSGLQERLAALPGVDRVAMTDALPLNYDINGSSYYLEGDPEPDPGVWQIGMRRAVVPGYFATMGIPLVDGRDFEATDDADAPRVVIVNNAFAQRHTADGDVLGRRLTWDDPLDDEELTWATIIGVTGDTRYLDLDQPDDPAVYSPYAESPGNYQIYAMRTSRSSEELAPEVRVAVWELDDRLPAAELVGMSQRISDSLDEPRHTSLLLALFGGVALLLAGVGLYGVVSFAVGEQIREIGIRMAFGARPGQIMKRVLRSGLSMVVLGAGIGLGAGLAGSLAFTHYLREALFEVAVLDPVTYVLVPIVLLAVASIAALVPALRAMRLSPMEVLRYE